MTIKMVTGNEALALGALRAGVKVVTGYPGTPSTGALASILAMQPEGVHVEWSTNEKVALEVATGASFTGARALVAMKHVGLNVAADPLMTLAYTGLSGGMVIVSADDPGMHSSQNEQDNRFYARFAGIPMLEPRDADEARELTRRAFDLSERYDTPVLLRVTTRISHSKGVVRLEEPQQRPPLERNPLEPSKYVMLPSFARARAVVKLDRLEKLRDETEEWVFEEKGAGTCPEGVITSGICYNYVREVAPDVDVLCLLMTYPLPRKAIQQFAEQHEQVIVIEELDTFLSDQIRSLGIETVDLGMQWKLGELDPDRVADLLGRERVEIQADDDLPPPAPPVMCPGCPHRSTFYVLKNLGLEVTGDIGCYTLGALPPLNAMNTCVNMGGGVAHAFGIEKAHGPKAAENTVAVIGDSTFLHSGIAPLVDMAWNRSGGVLLILDNRTTAMTGRQPTAASSPTGTNEPCAAGESPPIEFEALCRAAGIEDVAVVDPFDLGALDEALKKALADERPLSLDDVDAVLWKWARARTLTEDKDARPLR